MRLKFAASTAIAVLIATGATRGWADKGSKKKDGDGAEVPANINKQFDWENKVVGPKEGLDRNRLAAIQEQGRREDEARKKEPPKKQTRAEGIDAPASATLPTMDIEKAAAPRKTGPRRTAAAAPRQKDALDDLLAEQGVKPDSASDGGLNGVLASGDKSTSGSKKKKARRH